MNNSHDFARICICGHFQSTHSLNGACEMCNCKKFQPANEHVFVTVLNEEDPEVGGFFAYQKGEEGLGWQAWRGWGETPYVAIQTLMEVLIEQGETGAG